MILGHDGRAAGTWKECKSCKGHGIKNGKECPACKGKGGMDTGRL